MRNKRRAESLAKIIVSMSERELIITVEKIIISYKHFVTSQPTIMITYDVAGPHLNIINDRRHLSLPMF